MDSFKGDFQFIMRRLYSLLPVSLAKVVIDVILDLLFQRDYIDFGERDYLCRINTAYFDVLGGSDYEG